MDSTECWVITETDWNNVTRESGSRAATEFTPAILHYLAFTYHRTQTAFQCNLMFLTTQ